MKIQSRKKTSKRLAIFLIVSAFVLIGAYFTYAYISKTLWPFAATEPHASPDKNPAIENISEPQQDKTRAVNTDTAPAVTEDQTGKQQVAMVASYDTSGDTVYIRGGINNSAVYDGECSAELTGPNGKTIHKATSLLQNAATTDCKTIQIPTSDLSSGIWKYKLVYTSATTEGSSSEGTFEIK